MNTNAHIPRRIVGTLRNTKGPLLRTDTNHDSGTSELLSVLHMSRTYYYNQTQQRPQTSVVAHGFGAVGFPARAGTSPEGHEEACTTTDRVRGQRSTAPRGRRLDSLARCCAPDAGSYKIQNERREPRVVRREVGGRRSRWWRADGERESGAGGVYIPRRTVVAASSACWFCASPEVDRGCSRLKA